MRSVSLSLSLGSIASRVHYIVYGLWLRCGRFYRGACRWGRDESLSVAYLRFFCARSASA